MTSTSHPCPPRASWTSTGPSQSVSTDYEEGRVPSRMRTRAEVARFFDGLELVGPGLVTATEWFEDGPAPKRELSGFHVGVARVPGGSLG